MIQVWTGPQTIAGILDRNEYTFIFSYDRQCPASSSVSLTMPVTLQSYDYIALHPIFQMNLPEGAMLRAIENRLRKVIPEMDQFDLLRYVGRSQIGRLRYSGDGTPADVPAQGIDEILRERGTLDLRRHLFDTFLSSSGVSGVQPKVLVREKVDGPEVVDKLVARGATHLVKTFDENEYPGLATNEFFCMRVAHHAGLPIPEMSLSDNGQFLVITRFDLTADGRYLGFEDFCALSALNPDRKYDASYEELAKRIHQFVSPEALVDALKQFFTSVTLSCALVNGDAHLKNFGVLYEDSESPVVYSPTFDIVTTTVYQPLDTMALTMNGSKFFPRYRQLLKFGVFDCRLPVEEVDAIIGQVSEAVTKTRSEVVRHITDFPAFSDVGASMLKSWETGVEKINDKEPPGTRSRRDNKPGHGLW